MSCASWGFTGDLCELQREREKVQEDSGSVKTGSPGNPLPGRRSPLEILVTWFDRKAGAGLCDVSFRSIHRKHVTIWGKHWLRCCQWLYFLFLRNTLRRSRYGHLRQLILYCHWNTGNLNITLPTGTRTIVSELVEDLGLYRRSKKAQKSVGW